MKRSRITVVLSEEQYAALKKRAGLVKLSTLIRNGLVLLKWITDDRK